MVITAYSDIEPILRAINEGLVARYIVKPWNEDELVQILRWATERVAVRARVGRRCSVGCSRPSGSPRSAASAA